MLHFYIVAERQQNFAVLVRECGKISAAVVYTTHAIYKQCISLSHMLSAVGFLLFFIPLAIAPSRRGSQYFILFISRHVPSVLSVIRIKKRVGFLSINIRARRDLFLYVRSGS